MYPLCDTNLRLLGGKNLDVKFDYGWRSRFLAVIIFKRFLLNLKKSNKI